MAIAARTISDWNSFDSTTNVTDKEDRHGKRHIAGLYYFFMTDYLVDIAYGLSKEVFKKPQDFKNFMGAANIDKIAEFRYQYGRSVTYLDKDQRSDIYHSVFGTGESTFLNDNSDFGRLLSDIIRASVDFRQNSSDKGIGFLVSQQLYDAHRTFVEYLDRVHGDSLKWSCAAFQAIYRNIIEKIYYVPSVLEASGVHSGPGPNWPYRESSNGAQMVERLAAYGEHAVCRSLTRERFSKLHRVALRGGEALAAIIDVKAYSDPEDLRILTEKCCSWQLSLQQLSTHLGAGNHPGEASTILRLPVLSTPSTVWRLKG